MTHRILLISVLAATAAACGTSSDGDATSDEDSVSTGGQAVATGGALSGGAANVGGTSTTGGASYGGAANVGGTSTTGGTASGGETANATGGGDVGTGGSEAEGVGGQLQTGGATGAGGSPQVSCVGEAWPTADPTQAGPFQVAADKNVGPLAGDLPDPIYGDEQQRINVYRPNNLADSGYCHPILVWANGYTDNPEPNPPLCVVDSGANKWCGQYLPMMEHLASHGFVVVSSLSTATGRGDPLPTIVGLDWILEQAEDPSSPYSHRLATANLGQLGHSFGGMSTCMSAAEPRYKALATICGTAALSGVHTPMLFFCGGNDATVQCSGVRDTFLTVTDHPAFFINELNADHGSW